MPQGKELPKAWKPHRCMMRWDLKRTWILSLTHVGSHVNPHLELNPLKLIPMPTRSVQEMGWKAGSLPLSQNIITIKETPGIAEMIADCSKGARQILESWRRSFVGKSRVEIRCAMQGPAIVCSWTLVKEVLQVLHVTTIYVESNCQSSWIVIGFKNLSTLRTITSINTQSMNTQLRLSRCFSLISLGSATFADCQLGHARTATLVQAVAENQAAGDAPQICPSALPWSASRHLPSIFWNLDGHQMSPREIYIYWDMRDILGCKQQCHGVVWRWGVQ